MRYPTLNLRACKEERLSEMRVGDHSAENKDRGQEVSALAAKEGQVRGLRGIFSAGLQVP